MRYYTVNLSAISHYHCHQIHLCASNIMSFIPELFAHPGLDKIAKENAFDACLSDPGLPIVADPVAPATTPYWFDTPHPRFTSLSKMEKLPKEAEDSDMVIIGSGITGTSVARGLLRGPKANAEEGMKVVMLEARDRKSVV